MDRLATHALKEQRNHVVGVEGQTLAAKLGTQPENLLATSATSLDTSSRYVEAHQKGQVSKQ